MVVLQNILSAVTDFLSGAQSLGIVKEYSLTCSDNFAENADTEELISKLLNAVNGSPTTEENVSSSSSEPVSKDEGEINDEKSENENKPEAECEKDSAVNKNLVQIQVDANEMKRRISAFISRKRKEVDEWNVQEFCNRPYIEEQNPLWEELNSCARVDAVFVPRSGSKSHVKVSKVENRWGPQTHLPVGAKKIKLEPVEETENHPDNASLQAIEERLQSMESHLKLKTESSRTNIFQRLKNLEDRILYLEGISPDYFNVSGLDYQSPKKKSYSEKTYSNWSMDEIQKRIQTLKESLKMKSLHLKSEPAE